MFIYLVLTSLEAKSGEKTKLEIMAEMRDYKRRRQSYRGKNKSNAKLTAIEVRHKYCVILVEVHKLSDINPRHILDVKSSGTPFFNGRKGKCSINWVCSSTNLSFSQPTAFLKFGYFCEMKRADECWKFTIVFIINSFISNCARFWKITK